MLHSSGRQPLQRQLERAKPSGRAPALPEAFLAQFEPLLASPEQIQFDPAATERSTRRSPPSTARPNSS